MDLPNYPIKGYLPSSRRLSPCRGPLPPIPPAQLSTAPTESRFSICVTTATGVPGRWPLSPSKLPVGPANWTPARLSTAVAVSRPSSPDSACSNGGDHSRCRCRTRTCPTGAKDTCGIRGARAARCPPSRRCIGQPVGPSITPRVPARLVPTHSHRVANQLTPSIEWHTSQLNPTELHTGQLTSTEWHTNQLTPAEWHTNQLTTTEWAHKPTHSNWVAHQPTHLK